MNFLLKEEEKNEKERRKETTEGKLQEDYILLTHFCGVNR